MINKPLFSAALLLALSPMAAHADKCTGQIEGYLAAQRTAIESHNNGIPGTEGINTAQASEQIRIIEQARTANQTDCEIRLSIGLFQATDQALDHAMNTIKK